MITPVRSTPKALDNALPISLGDFHKAQGGRGDVLPIVDLGARHDESVSLRHRRDRQEGHDVVVFVDEAPGYLAVDDLGEDGSHTNEATS